MFGPRPGEIQSSVLAVALAAGCQSGPLQGRIALDDNAPSAHRATVRAAPERSALPEDGVLELAYAPMATELDDAAWAPLVEHLSGRLGVRIQPVPYPSYAELSQAMREQQVELALLAPLTYVMAKKENPALEPLVQTLSEGKTSYSAYLFVERASPYRGVEDLRGARVAFVDRRSTSGFLMPYAQLLEAGISPERDLAEMVYTGSHVDSLFAVAHGQADAAASYADVLPWAGEQALEQGWEMPAFRVLGNAGRIPLDVLVAGSGVSEPLREVIRDELLATNTTTGPGRAFFVSSGRIVGWAETSDERYMAVRAVWERVEAERGETP
jgi:phosphonate transport system substrate-binding protein